MKNMAEYNHSQISQSKILQQKPIVGFKQLPQQNNPKIKNLDPRFNDISLIEESPISKEQTKTNFNISDIDNQKPNQIHDIYSPEYGYEA